MLKRFLGTALLALIILTGVLLWRTFTYGGAPEHLRQIELTEPPEIDAEQAARHLSQAIRFRTITLQSGDPRPGQEGPWLDMQAWIRETYPAFHSVARRETIPDTLSLLYTWPGRDPALKPLLLMAHQDVVPVNIGTEGDWQAPPFSGDIKQGYIYGRGAIDDKGSMIGLFEATEALARSGFSPRRTILIMLGHDEEVSGSGAASGIAYLKAMNTEPVMALDEGFMAVENNPLTGGTLAFIGVAEKGYLTLHLTASAEGGHSSTPPRNSATIRLAKALLALEKNQMPADLSSPPVSTLFETAAPHMPFLQRMVFANQWLFGGLINAQMGQIPSANAMIRTTTAPTMLSGSAKENILAQRASAIINFRIHPNDSEDDILEHVRNVTSGIEGIEVRRGTSGIRGQGASAISPMNSLSYAVLHAVASEISGAPVAPGLVLGATDARYASAITDNVYRFMPALMSPEELTGFHGTNERISIENMGRLATGYAQIILAMDTHQEDP